MDTIRSQADGDRPGGDDPHRDGGPVGVDVLDRAAAEIAALEASASARALLAEVLAATLAAFTLTRSTRDPLPDTAPRSAEEALAVVAGLDHLRSSLAALDANWQVRAEQRITQDDRVRGVPAERQGKGANQEIALARQVSPSSNSFSLAAARRLVRQLPGTTSALRRGRLTPQQASTISTTLDGADAETCARIDRMIAEDPETLRGKGVKRVASDVREMIQHLEPDGSRDRAERAARRRHVTMTPLADGMARIGAVVPGPDAVALMTALQQRAESLRAAGSRTPGRALEADLLVDAVLGAHEAGWDLVAAPEETAAERDGQESAAVAAESPSADGSSTGSILVETERAPGAGLEVVSTGDSGAASAADPATSAEDLTPAPGTSATATPEPGPLRPRPRPTLQIGIVITDTALLGREDEHESARLDGFGGIPAHVITDTLRGHPPGRITPGPDDPLGEHPDQRISAFYRRLYTSPRTGELIGMESRARAFPAGLATLIRWRDVTCATPWCNAVIRQIDHVLPHHRGGGTTFENGQGLCARCNQAKEHGTWRIVPLRGGRGSADDVPEGALPTEGALPPDGSLPPQGSGREWSSPHGAVGISLPRPLFAPRPPEIAGDTEEEGTSEEGTPSADGDAPAEGATADPLRPGDERTAG
ncbi:HNH endonuclease [Brachybacterium aquaticum]|uniref:HNH nuclease domain-containing protein n=1 Tax=Brachybacterium aquaticum TaxID=1432564 RepID=A0A841AF03_9MICO|nr:DUF222 domain-containing protein [Brachybacterium aquaticum]MBB5831852.1 hypothetical protein [Brachybacterium aquaticum]